MDTATVQINKADNKEHELIEELLECSENESQQIKEGLERVVITSSWEEAACGWKETSPNVRYITSADRKKKAKEKYCQTSHESETHYTKVKRLAGIITNSNSNTGVSDVRTDLKNSIGSWPGNRAFMTNMRNFQNADVLSYDTPCWRYIIDPRTLHYVERTPLQALRNMSSSHKYPHKTLILENGGMITFQETFNGGIAINDPALSFDRRLVEGLHLSEDHGRYGGKVTLRFPSSLEQSMPILTHFRTDDDKNKLIHTEQPKKQNNPLLSCELCKFRSQDLPKPDTYQVDCKLEIRNHSFSDLKPLQKITPTQRQTAEESILVKAKSEKACGRSKDNKALNQKKKTGPGGEGKLDWLPITRNTFGYPYPSANLVNTTQSKFPDRMSAGFSKAFSLPRHSKKGKKLTLSEAANLVPSRGKLGHALEKLSQELDRKVEKGIPVSETLLPSVSGTKLEVPPLANLWDS